MPRHDPTNRKSSKKSSSRDWLDTAKHYPKATAAAAAGTAGAVAAGVYLWSKRNSISSQMRDWTDKLYSGRGSRELMKTEGPNESDAIEASRRTQSRSTGRSAKARRTSGRAEPQSTVM